MKIFVRRLLSVLERGLRKFAERRGYGALLPPPPTRPIWALDCSPDSLEEWKRLVSSASRSPKSRGGA